MGESSPLEGFQRSLGRIVECAECGYEAEVWPKKGGPLPTLVHHPNGTHTCLWPDDASPIARETGREQ